jgi:hypothetical protein
VTEKGIGNKLLRSVVLRNRTSMMAGLEAIHG